jgi:hypothetical protein
MDLGVEGRRLAIEAIATLAHVKYTMAELLLKPAGISPEIYSPLLYKRDPTTGRTLTKRQIAPLLLDAISDPLEGVHVVRAIIEIAAHWSSFHLADDEYAARATVQKARELLGTIELMEAREAQQRDQARKEELARMERERADLLRRQSDLLLMMFDDLAKSDDPQRRGYLLQDLLNRTFDLHQIPVVRSFTRNEGGEQIDGAFKIEGWHYLVECRWRQKLADIRELDGLKGQVDRSGKQTMGLFLSVNGWSDHVPSLLKQNPQKSILLMDGYDLRMVLCGRADLRDFILAKIAKLNLEGEPFLGVPEYLNEVASAQ